MIERRKRIVCLSRRHRVRLAGSQIVKGISAGCIRIDDDRRPATESNCHARKWNVSTISDGAADVVWSGLIYENTNGIRLNGRDDIGLTIAVKIENGCEETAHLKVYGFLKGPIPISFEDA